MNNCTSVEAGVDIFMSPQFLTGKEKDRHMSERLANAEISLHVAHSQN